MPLAPLRTCIWFDGQAKEAAGFYTKLLGGKVEETLFAPADFPSGKKGQLLTVRCSFLGHGFELLDGGPEFKPNNAISFVIECDTQAEVDRYWKGLQAGGGAPQPCGWCVDRFGVSWQVVPKRLGELLHDKDPEKAKRAMEEMLKQEKLDIARLEEAAAGGAAPSSSASTSGRKSKPGSGQGASGKAKR